MKKFTLCFLLCTFTLCLCSCKSFDYKDAVSQYDAGQYQQAKEIFTELGDYKDSTDFVKKCSYADAISQYDAGQYQQAKKAFTELGEYEDSAEFVKKCSYTYSIQQMEKGNIKEAAKLLEELGEYEGSTYYLGLCFLQEENYASAIASFEKVTEASEYYAKAVAGIETCNCEILYQQALALCSLGDLEGAREILPKLTTFKKAQTLVKLFKKLDDEGFVGEYEGGGTTLQILAHINMNSLDRSYTVIVKDRKKELTYNPCIVVDNKILLQDETDLTNRKLLNRNCKETILIEDKTSDTGGSFWGIVSAVPGWETELLYLEKTPEGITEFEQKSYGAVDNHIAKDERDLLREKSEPKRTTQRKFTPVVNG